MDILGHPEPATASAGPLASDPVPASQWRAVWLLSAILAAGAVLLLATGLDKPLFLWINRSHLASDTALSMLSIGGLGITAVIAASALSAGGRLKLVAAMLWCLPIGGALIHWLKWAAALPRPASVLSPDAIHVVGQTLLHGSMPSGHSATAAAFCVLVARCGGPRSQRAPVLGTSGALLLCMAIAASRVAVGAHWPSDVLAGAALGIVGACLALRCEQRWHLATYLERDWGRRGVAVFQVGVGVAMIALPTGYPLAASLQWLLGAIGVGAGAVNLYASIGPRRHTARSASPERTAWTTTT